MVTANRTRARPGGLAVYHRGWIFEAVAAPAASATILGLRSFSGERRLRPAPSDRREAQTVRQE
jgi:hypothetical protein